MDYLIYKIKPKTPFHIGIKEGSLEKIMNYIHSDTIFGGICNAYRLIYGKDSLEKMLEKFKNQNPPFLISSAFPYFDEILFFPIPKMIDFFKFGVEDKKYKKIEFVSDGILQSISQNCFSEQLKSGNIVQGKILVTEEEMEKIGDTKIWNEKEIPRVVIDRKTNASNIYYFGEIEYCDKCGLYFLIKILDNSVESKLKAAIRLLGDEGIGGDRSYGRGLFELESKEPKKFVWDVNEGFFINLSLYVPADDEVEMIKNGYYDFISKSGWVYSPDKRGERKRFVRMIREGSTFKGNKEFYGELIDVSVSNEFHPVYKYGYGMPLYLGVLNEI